MGTIDDFDAGYRVGYRHGAEKESARIRRLLSELLALVEPGTDGVEVANVVLAAIGSDMVLSLQPDGSTEPTPAVASDQPPAPEDGDTWPSPQIQQEGNQYSLDTPIGVLRLPVPLYSELTQAFGSTLGAILAQPEKLNQVLHGDATQLWLVGDKLKAYGYDISPKVTDTWPARPLTVAKS